MNAAARTAADLRRYDHISISLAGLHRLRVPERVVFKLEAMVRTALILDILPISCVRSPTCQAGDGYDHLRHDARTYPTRLTTGGDRSFPVVAARARNYLPYDVTAAQTLVDFSRCLKTHFFHVSYPYYR
jgi:hypothetical protein